MQQIPGAPTMPAEFLVIDTETTGLDAGVDRVVEIAAVAVDPWAGTVTPAMTSLVNPGRPIPATASAVHHLTDDDVVGADGLEKVWEGRLAPWLDGRTVLVAHNAGFDRPFLPAMPNRWLCTMRLARHLWPQAPAYGNQVLRYWRSLRIETGPAHRALADATVTGHLLVQLAAAYRECAHPGDADLNGLVDLAAAPFLVTTMPFGKHKGSRLDEVPADYVRWLLQLPDLDADLRFSLEQIGRRRPDTA